MSDQCRHCTMRGDIEGCEEAECGYHGNWYAVEKNKQLDQIREENAALKEKLKEAEVKLKLVKYYNKAMRSALDKIKF